MTAVSASPAVVAGTTSEAVIPGAARAAQEASEVVERFVVGVDGSAQSIEALRWASRIAAGTAARIEVLTTWEPRLGLPGPFVGPADGTSVGPETDAQAVLARTVDAAYGKDHPSNVSVHARRGDAFHVLLEASRTADLLVIGSRGLGGVAGRVLGSVSARCAEQAHCPVLIIHEPGKR